MLPTIIYILTIIRRRLRKIGRGVSLVAAGYADGQDIRCSMRRKYAEE
jgi:hypothetical protein